MKNGSVRKRPREVFSPVTELIEVYEDLASIDENVRIKAAHTLLTKHVNGGLVSGHDIDQIIDRLVRGLCSGRKAARVGFAIALTETLTSIVTKPNEERNHLPDVASLLYTLREQTVASSRPSNQVCLHGSKCSAVLFLIRRNEGRERSLSWSVIRPTSILPVRYSFSRYQWKG